MDADAFATGTKLRRPSLKPGPKPYGQAALHWIAFQECSPLHSMSGEADALATWTSLSNSGHPKGGMSQAYRGIGFEDINVVGGGLGMHGNPILWGFVLYGKTISYICSWAFLCIRRATLAFVMHVTAKYYIVQQETLKSFGRKNHEASFLDGKNLSKNIRTTAHLFC